MIEAPQYAQYTAGVCNIGDAEIKRRKKIGWVGLILTALLLAVLFAERADVLWRLLAFFPATLGATGLFQARAHFCTGFAQRGIFNFGPVGGEHIVADDTSRAKDKKKGRQITIQAIFFGICVVIIALLL